MVMVYFIYFNHASSTKTSTLALHDALPISPCHAVAGGGTKHSGRPGATDRHAGRARRSRRPRPPGWQDRRARPDRKSTRLNSSHVEISYAVFCLKKKKRL